MPAVPGLLSAVSNGPPRAASRSRVGGGVVRDGVDVDVVGDFAVGGLQDLPTLDRAVAGLQRPMTLPVVMSTAAYRREVPARL
jgi:hypothetical protein